MLSESALSTSDKPCESESPERPCAFRGVEIDESNIRSFALVFLDGAFLDALLILAAGLATRFTAFFFFLEAFFFGATFFTADFFGVADFFEGFRPVRAFFAGVFFLAFFLAAMEKVYHHTSHTVRLHVYFTLGALSDLSESLFPASFCVFRKLQMVSLAFRS
jgi:hypothetical protein